MGETEIQAKAMVDFLTFIKKYDRETVNYCIEKVKQIEKDNRMSIY